MGTSDSKEHRGKVTRFRLYNVIKKKKKEKTYTRHTVAVNYYE